MSIAGDHGSSLLAKGQNIEESESGLVLSDYPSHGHVIDREKAWCIPKPLARRL